MNPSLHPLRVRLQLLTLACTLSFPVAQGQDQPAPKEEPKQKEPKQEEPKDPFPNAIEVPDGILDGGTEWLNCGKPIKLKDLRGKIVLLDHFIFFAGLSILIQA